MVDMGCVLCEGGNVGLYVIIRTPVFTELTGLSHLQRELSSIIKINMHDIWSQKCH